MRFEDFHMIDRIVALDLSGRSIRSVGLVPEAKSSTILQGHFPGYPLMPGALLLESMAQTAGWLLIALNGFTAMPFMAGAKDAKFRSAVLPGEAIEFEGRVIHEGSGYAVGEGKGRRDGKVVCNAQIIFTIMPFPSDAFRDALRARGERLELPVKELAR
ncbi:MAG TPA: beta-hydroxyacyl-ACP dehydratase [Xanthobacteraceae bacterium]|jgi:3-hydroxyacyl-[acyl-carrier-protein] dehydratase